MNERIKQLRKDLKLTQTEFGNRLGIKQTTVAGYETGGRVPIDAVISLICREFNVNEEWLRTGKGGDENRYVQQRLTCTIDDIYALPDGQRAELIDGQMYMMAPPNTAHQRISYSFARKISDYIDRKKENCEVFLAPFAVFLNQDNINYVEPDISVICDKEKIDEKGCQGAPDWIIEITSPSNPQNDYGVKLFKYRTAGVREYWIINPQKKSVMVYDLENDLKSNQYSFDDVISACIYEDFHIIISNLL